MEGWIEVERDVAAFDFVEDIAATAVNGDVDCGVAFASAFERGVGSVVEHEANDFHVVVAEDGMLEWAVLPVSGAIGVSSVGEEIADAFDVVPVCFAEEERGEAVFVEFATGEKDFEDGVVVGFGDVVRGLFIVGVGSAVEEELGEAGVLRDTGCSVDGGLNDLAWIGLVDSFVPAGVGAGSGVEESAGCVDEGFGARGIEAEVAGETEVGEGVPVVRASGIGGFFWVLGEELFDGGLVGEDGGGVDVRGGYLRIASEDELGVFEGAAAVSIVARDAGGFDEGGDGIGQVGEGADEALGFDVSGEFGQLSKLCSRARMSWASVRVKLVVRISVRESLWSAG